MSFKIFSIFSSGGHFVEGNGTIFAMLVEGHPRNIKLFLNRAIVLRGCRLKAFLFLALMAILFSRAEQF